MLTPEERKEFERLYNQATATSYPYLTTKTRARLNELMMKKEPNGPRIPNWRVPLPPNDLT